MGRTLALAAIALVASVALGGCVTLPGRDTLILALSAPKAASGMTLFLVNDNGIVDKITKDTDSAEYAIYFGDKLIYPPGGNGADFPVSGRTGSVFIPYNLFVVGNGDYDVLVKYAGSSTRARVTVEKWVEFVYLHPFEKDNIVVVEAALASATGGRPEDRVLSSGDLILNIHYRGQDGTEDRTIGSVTGSTKNDEIGTKLEVPRSRFSQGRGYYSFEPVFHNLEAKDNVQVPGDPTMGNRLPPWNWIWIS
jgi:hypothetical protein